MSWIKKTVHKVKKSVRRMAHGKFHFSKNGFFKAVPISRHGWTQTYTHLLSKHQQHRLAKAFDWGRFKKKYLNRIFSGNNSASAVFYDSGSGYVPGGYQYRGRTLSQMTGGY